MLFIDNKYTKWYFQIIESAKLNPPTNYSEKHHIIPQCMNGSNDPDNLVALSARQHFICHMLLTRMVSDEPYLSKLKYAAILLKSTNNFNVTSKVYEQLKSNIKQTPEWIVKRTSHFKGRVSPTKGMVPWNKGLTKDTSESVRQSSKQPKGQRAWNKGMLATEEHKRNIKAGMKKANISYEHMRKRVACKHCGVESTPSAITRYHNDNCKSLL